MALEALELFCNCCEICLWLGSLGEQREAKAAAPAKAAQTSRLVRMVREEKRGVRLRFEKRHISEIEFIGGPAAGKHASELPDMELKRLALALPHRTARFAVRRYLRHRKKGTVPAPNEPVIRR